jgi:hypothetical protein
MRAYGRPCVRSRLVHSAGFGSLNPPPCLAAVRVNGVEILPLQLAPDLVSHTRPNDWRSREPLLDCSHEGFATRRVDRLGELQHGGASFGI